MGTTHTTKKKIGNLSGDDRKVLNQIIRKHDKVQKKISKRRMSIKKQNSIKKLQKKVKFKLSADLVDVESQKQSTEGIPSPQKATVDSGTENHFLILDEFGTDHDFPSD